MERPSHDEFGDPDEMSLRVPAQPQFARVIRLAVAGVASRNGYSYDDVSDLRIAVGEVFGALLEPEVDGASVSLQCRLDAESMVVVAQRQPASEIESPGELTRQILDGVTDEFNIEIDLGRFTIVKRPPTDR